MWERNYGSAALFSLPPPPLSFFFLVFCFLGALPPTNPALLSVTDVVGRG